VGSLKKDLHPNKKGPAQKRKNFHQWKQLAEKDPPWGPGKRSKVHHREGSQSVDGGPRKVDNGIDKNGGGTTLGGEEKFPDREKGGLSCSKKTMPRSRRKVRYRARGTGNY